MAPKTSWHRYGTKLRHSHPMYKSFQTPNTAIDSVTIVSAGPFFLLERTISSFVQRGVQNARISNNMLQCR